MKFVCSLLCLFLFSCASGKETIYTGSTPGSPVLRSFLGIPMKDSIDFIRWELRLEPDSYRLQCHYGIGKPNTDGFINGGNKLELTGIASRANNYYLLKNDGKTLKIAVLNANLLHFLDLDDHLLIGNGGWSYTLNNIAPVATDQVNFSKGQFDLKDSLEFEGRTAGGIPGIWQPGKPYYKLKLYLILYGNGESGSGHYRIYGIPMPVRGPVTGRWEMITGIDGRVTYRLNDPNGKASLFLLKIGDGLLLFTDPKGNLLVGNKDFSYTLNKIQKQ